MSRDIGTGVWAVKFDKPAHAKNQAHKTFYDKANLRVAGAGEEERRDFKVVVL